ncbi:MotA/TolQ/ExbB proton channel family protein [Oceanicella actignis]|uniref:MotA/TolQ/ExbB proton channel family protein n=1 Tax=Oceanicella actignis TaxID=1189325 RepID=UPI001252E52C|nr:MotA/TolQ/ExbB proton channel family protein [Oceanicella actignis]TYO91309.1 outer membrane transport energization protein ExbB [Oceanicella actignis]
MTRFSFPSPGRPGAAPAGWAMLALCALAAAAAAQESPRPPATADAPPEIVAPAQPEKAGPAPRGGPEGPTPRAGSTLAASGQEASAPATRAPADAAAPKAAAPGEAVGAQTEAASDAAMGPSAPGASEAGATAAAAGDEARAEAPAPGAASASILSAMGVAGGRAWTFLRDGGPAMWAIAALSVATLALILWKIWRLALMGAWSRGRAERAVETWRRADAAGALALVEGRRGVRAQVLAAAMRSLERLPVEAAREETARVAKRQLAMAREGLGALELIAGIAPLLGLLGTVLGMIAAFRTLQEAGSRADPALLAGGIWEALLTTAAGMAVAIPASAALTWFESVVERMRADIEDNATRIFVAARPEKLRLAAE